MDVIYLFKVLLRRKWTIIFCTAVGIIGGLIFRIFISKQYVSQAQYSTGFVQTQKVSLEMIGMLDVSMVDFRLTNVIETFKSPVVLGMLSYDLLLHDLEDSRPFRQLSEKARKDTSYQNSDFYAVKKVLHGKLNSMKLLSLYDPSEKKVWDLINLYGYDDYSILRGITIERIPKTDYINVSFSSENPELSAYITNNIGDKFKQFYLAITRTSTKESLTKLDSLRASKQREVGDLREKLQKYRDQIGTPNLGDAATAAMDGVRELTSSLMMQQAALNENTQKINSINEQLAALNAVQASPVANNNADEILLLKKQNDALIQQKMAGTGNPADIERKMQANLDRISALRGSSVSVNPLAAPKFTVAEQRAALIAKKLELESDNKASNANVEMYSGRLAGFRKIAFSGGGQEVVAQAYQNDLLAAQRDLEKYNNSLFTAQDIDVSPDFNFKQIILGQPSLRPEPTHGFLITGIAGLSLFFLSSLFIVIFELLDSSVRSPSIFSKESHVELLGVLGKVELTKKSVKDYFDFDPKSEREQGALPFVENLRKLRYQLEDSGKKVILITSTRPQVGKTVVLESLAHTFSRSKKKLLLIDSNFSNNSLTRDFGAKPALEGFSMNGHGDGESKLWEITTITSITNTDIIGCEEGNYTPEEILPKGNVFTHLDKLKERYDYIFVEGAALNQHSDSRELLPYADGVIAVFSANETLTESDKESLAYLKEQGDKFLGAVLNKTDEQNVDA